MRIAFIGRCRRFPRSRAISAVLLERLVGFAALIFLGLIGASALYTSVQMARAYVLLSAVGAALAVTVLVLMLIAPHWREVMGIRARWLAPVEQNLRSVARARGAWVPLIGLSLLFQAQAILIIHAICLSLHLPIDLSRSALIAAAAGLATVIPFSVNGLGIVEATIAGAAVAVGVPYQAGLAVALLIRVLVVPLTLLAGLIYAFEPVRAQRIATTGPSVSHRGSGG
jgi:uncharacterized membrane protein YbhN (UPF0104 family)